MPVEVPAEVPVPATVPFDHEGIFESGPRPDEAAAVPASTAPPNLLPESDLPPSPGSPALPPRETGSSGDTGPRENGIPSVPVPDFPVPGPEEKISRSPLLNRHGQFRRRGYSRSFSGSSSGPGDRSGIRPGCGEGDQDRGYPRSASCARPQRSAVSAPSRQGSGGD